MLKAPLSPRAVIGHALLPALVAALLTVFPFEMGSTKSEIQPFLDFAPQYSLGYPVFLKIFSLFPDQLHIATLTQSWIFSISVFCLSVSIYRISTSHFFGILTAFCLLLNPFLLTIHFQIQPDSLLISTILLALACLLANIAQPAFLKLCFFGLFIGIAMTLHPFALAYAPLILIAAPLIARKNHCSSFKAFLVPLIFCLLVTLPEAATYNTLHKGEAFRPAVGPMYANAALMQSHQASPYAEKDPRTAIWNKIETDLEAIRSEIWEATSFIEQKKLLLSQQTHIGKNFATNALTQAGFMLDKTPDDIRMDIASSRIIQDPLAFLSISFAQYQRIWISDNYLSLPFLAITLLTAFIGLWAWLKGTCFNGAFALAFCSAFCIQAQTILQAVCGVGHPNALVFLSPLMILTLLGLILGFYLAFINPPRTNG